MSNSSKKIITVLLIIICVYSVINTGLSAFTLYTIFRNGYLYNDDYYYDEYPEDVAQEDDVLIADEYMIKSTLNISDAYKSGDSSQLSGRDKETLDMASEVLDSIITDDMTDYEKEKAVYEWLTSGFQNSTDMLTVINEDDYGYDNPHDVLKNHSAVCVGYATTFRMLMQMMDIDCMVVHSSDLIHSWDLVNLDGDWYHVDCYYDSDGASYMSFNMNDEICMQSHEWNMEFFPAAEGVKYNYALSVCEELGDVYEIPSWLLSAIQERKAVISCTFKGGLTEQDEAAAAYIAEALVDRLMILDSTQDLSVSYNWITNENGDSVLCFYNSYYDYGIYVDVDDETAQKIDSSIDEAIDSFGLR